MVVNSGIILRLNMLLSFPFTCLSSRWVLKARYHLLTNYLLNWDPVKNNNNKTPRSLKGISVLFFSPRGRRWSQGAGLSLPCPGWVTQLCLVTPWIRWNLSLPAEWRCQNPFHRSLTRIKGRHGSQVSTSVIYLNLSRRQITLMQLFKHSSNDGKLFTCISAGPS